MFYFVNVNSPSDKPPRKSSGWINSDLVDWAFSLRPFSFCFKSNSVILKWNVWSLRVNRLIRLADVSSERGDMTRSSIPPLLVPCAHAHSLMLFLNVFLNPLFVYFLFLLLLICIKCSVLTRYTNTFRAECFVWLLKKVQRMLKCNSFNSHLSPQRCSPPCNQAQLFWAQNIVLFFDLTLKLNLVVFFLLILFSLYHQDIWRIRVCYFPFYLCTPVS